MTRVATYFFIATVFLGSFLLFAVQPIVGKYIQPWFGSTSAVWNTCLMFFQGVLFLGYLYAHALGRLSPKRQLNLHGALVLATLAIGFWHFTRWGSSILLPATAAPDAPPALSILLVLVMTIGFPFLLLSSNSTLIQHWYNYAEPDKNAYPLYAVSNAGSLLALLAYPFLLEPFFGLRVQSHLWYLLLLLYGAAVLICARVAIRRRIHPRTSDTTQDAALRDVAEPFRADLPSSRIATWFLLTMTGSILLLAVTSELTQNVSPVPFLWVVPLAVYLLTFILGFSRLFARYRPATSLLLLLGAILALYAMTHRVTLPIGHMILLMSLSLFAVCLYCHGTLYATRPDHRHLTFFYMIVSLGGFVGGFFVSIIAPLLFPAYWELYIGLALALVLAARQWLVLRMLAPVWRYAAVAVAVLLCGVLAHTLITEHRQAIFHDRNFYGTIRVEQEMRGEGEQEIRRNILKHGDIVHGIQFSRTEYRYRPVAYFNEESGVGRAILHHPLRAQSDRPFRFGVVGGGIGTLVAYAREGDMMHLYELNPAVQDLAENTEYFTYLSDYADRWTASIGDGRLLLAEELAIAERPHFDILVIDAFNGDAVPVHLLTQEAIQLYLDSMDPEYGILALQITNKHVDFLPLIRAITDTFQLNTVVIEMPGDGIISQHNRWALLTRNPDTFRQPVFQRDAISLINVRSVAMWTDDRSSLFGLLKFR